MNRKAYFDGAEQEVRAACERAETEEQTSRLWDGRTDQITERNPHVAGARRGGGRPPRTV